MRISHEYRKNSSNYQYEVHDDGVKVRRVDDSGTVYEYKFIWGMKFVTNRNNPIEIVSLKKEQKSFVAGFYPLARYLEKEGTTDCSLSEQIDILIKNGEVVPLQDSCSIDPEEYITDREALIKLRRGQAQFRADVMDVWRNCCAVTQNNCHKLLIASHIKPWKVSDDVERLDPFNGLMLIATIDKAFDSGLISFDDKGNILISKYFVDFESAGICSTMKIDVKEKNKFYLDYHRKNVFEKL